MNKDRLFIWMTMLALFVILGGTAGYLWTGHAIKQQQEQEEQKVVPLETEETEANAQPSPQPSTPVTAEEETITPSTKMVYQYYYPSDDVTETAEEVPPYFLVGLTRNDMETIYREWELLSFSPKEVVLRRTVEGNSHERYIVGIRDGFVAVFYEEEQNGVSLKEQTNIPVSSLDKAEQERLAEGILVVGKDQLSQVLQDYGS